MIKFILLALCAFASTFAKAYDFQMNFDGGRTSINMNTHGIYIVKVVDLTAKLSL